jgi:hypothetical protein
MSSEKSTRTWNGNVCDPVSKTTWSARDERLWRCHCSLRRFSSMTCITKWSHVRATKKNSRLLSLKVEAILFVPSAEIEDEDRNEVDVGNWANKMQELCD